MPLIRRRPLAGLAALGAVALIAGCGGGSDGMSADDFREQADAICADVDRQLDALGEPDSAEAFLPFLRSGLEIQSTQLEQLQALEPPAELEGTYDEALDLLAQQQAAITGAADRIEAGEEAEAVITEVDSQIESINEQADAKAEELGLTECGSDDGERATETGAASVTAPTTAPSTSPAPPATGTTGMGATGAYVADVQEATDALQSFGTLLQGTTSVDDLKAKIPEAQGDLDAFDAAIAKLERHSLPTEQLERQRTGLLRTGPQVSDALRRFLDAAGTGDLTAVQGLLPEVTRTIGDFQESATTG